MPDDEDHAPLLTTDQLPQPWRGMIEALSAHDGHPARGWFERIGNGVFEDDHSGLELPAPHPIYRFRRGEWVAYVWQANDEWLVRPWQGRRRRVSQTVLRVPNLLAALNELARPLQPFSD